MYLTFTDIFFVFVFIVPLPLQGLESHWDSLTDYGAAFIAILNSSQPFSFIQMLEGRGD